jgi:hypothetical protein
LLISPAGLADVPEVMMDSFKTKTTKYLPVPLEVKALPDAKQTVAAECIRCRQQIGVELKRPSTKSCTEAETRRVG